LPQRTKRGLLVTTWILSTPSIAAGLAATFFHWWTIFKDLSWGGPTGNRAFGWWIWIVVLLNIGLWTALPATVCAAVLWGSKNVPLKSKINGSIWVVLAWVGEAMFFIWHD
jgi:hypothetical protein